VPLTALARELGSAALIPELLNADLWWVAALAAVQALVSTALTLLLGVPISAAVMRYRFPGRALVIALLTVPFVLPTVVVALAMKTALGELIGTGWWLVIAAHVYINIAVVVRIVGARWMRLDSRLEGSARTLGATNWQAFRTVTWPAIRASVVTAAAVVFTFSFTSLGVVLIAGDGHVRTLESVILRKTSLLLDFPGAAVAALIQALFVGVALVIAARSANASGSTASPRLRTLPRAGTARWAVPLIAVLAAAWVLFPLLGLVSNSITSSSGFTLRWWTALMSPTQAMLIAGHPGQALLRSALLALITAVIAATIGSLAAIAIMRGSAGGRLLSIAAMIPLGISAATIGLGTMLAFGRPPLDLRGVGLLIPIAHALIAVPLVVAVAAPALRAADVRPRAVAAMLGASPTRAWLTCFGPTIGTVAGSAAALAAAVSFGEFGAASFLARADSLTAPLVIARLLGKPGDALLGTASALAVALALATLLLVVMIDRLSQREVR
jgi:thiamine transport system permease protein